VDGLGVAPEGKENIISEIETPNLDELISKYPTAALKAEKGFLGNNYYSLGGRSENIGALIEEAGLKQIKISEAEKYSYLSFFFNGKNQEFRKGEEKKLIRTGLLDDYEQKPAMASVKIIDQIIKTVKEGRFNLITAALANLDMMSYSSNKTAVQKALRETDKAIKKISKAVLNKDGSLFITACKGGVEKLGKRGRGAWKVPFLMIGKDWEGRTTEAGETPGSNLSLMKASGTLLDVAPTILMAMNIEYNGPGKSLID
jgi:2,3-bisphosphoglycerate-independent phosphoglycerate mutase